MKFLIGLILIGLAPAVWGADRPAPVKLETLAESAVSGLDAHLNNVFKAAVKNLDTQIVDEDDGTAYVGTGDIPAEWLRDSSVEVRPFLFFVKKNPAAAELIRRVVLRQFRSLAIDSYANAFKRDYQIWERKFELDSLAYPILLAWTYWQASGDSAFFTGDIQKGMVAALETMEREQDHAGNSKYTHPDLNHRPVAKTGMIWTGFRPSDDACEFNFLIPAEMMAVQALNALEEIENVVYHADAIAARAARLRVDVKNGIMKYGLVKTSSFGQIFAYEVDGLGHALVMDDANLPNLVSAPYFGFVAESDLNYVRTRKWALSDKDPFFYQGQHVGGLGSPHTDTGMVWPLGLLSEMFTTDSTAEKTRLLSYVLASDTGDHLMHESFDPDWPLRFTRADFGWPNAMLVEYVLTQHGWPALPKVSETHFPKRENDAAAITKVGRTYRIPSQ